MLSELLVKTVKRKFGTWQRCEGIRSKLVKAVETDAVEVAKLTIAYVSTALPFIPQWVFSRMYWRDTLLLFALLSTRLQPKEIPLLKPSASKDSDTVSWDYDGRFAIYTLHTLAQAYGWTVEYIYSLDVDIALRLLQEVWTDEHLHKEFTYSLSEIAYPYNATSKTSRFKPLDRPYWMLGKVKEIKTYSIPKALMPAGAISNDAMGKELVQKFKEYQQQKRQKT